MTDALPDPERWSVDADGRLVVSTGIFGDLVVPGSADLAEIERLLHRARHFMAQSLSENTRLAYAQAWRRYVKWHASVFSAEGDPDSRSPLGAAPYVIGMHLASLADPPRRHDPDGVWRKPKPLARKTIRIALDAIVCAHRFAGLAIDTDDPAIRVVLEGILRERAGEDEAKAEPILLPMLRKMVGVARAEGGVMGARNRLLLTLGWSAGLRRSELTALVIGDVQRTARGLLITIRRSKADQVGRGARVAVERSDDADIDACRALDEWLSLRDDISRDAPLFTSLKRNGLSSGKPLPDRTVTDIVAGLAALADPEAVREAALRGASFSAHSLRAGVATQAAHNGAHLLDIMHHLRHSKPDTTAVYTRDVDIWRAGVSGTALGVKR